MITMSRPRPSSGTDYATETVESSELPAECTAADCEADPEWAWRDGHLWRHEVARYLTPCVCDDCVEDAPPEGLSDGGEWVRVRAVSTDGGTPHATIADAEGEISTGDVAVDLAYTAPVQVVGREEQPAGEHPHTRSDANAELFGVEPDEPVYSCVYLPSPDDGITPPSKTYSFPESRLLRYPVEDATNLASIQSHIRVAVLEDLVEAAAEGDDESILTVSELTGLVSEAYGEDVSELVPELLDSVRGVDA